MQYVIDYTYHLVSGCVLLWNQAMLRVAKNLERLGAGYMYS